MIFIPNFIIQNVKYKMDKVTFEENSDVYVYESPYFITIKYSDETRTIYNKHLDCKYPEDGRYITVEEWKAFQSQVPLEYIGYVFNSNVTNDEIDIKKEPFEEIGFYVMKNKGQLLCPRMFRDTSILKYKSWKEYYQSDQNVYKHKGIGPYKSRCLRCYTIQEEPRSEEAERKLIDRWRKEDGKKWRFGEPFNTNFME